MVSVLRALAVTWRKAPRWVAVAAVMIVLAGRAAGQARRGRASGPLVARRDRRRREVRHRTACGPIGHRSDPGTGCADDPGGSTEGADRQRLRWRSPATPLPSIRSSSSRASRATWSRSTSEDGALVKKGDLLFTIQQDQYKAQLQQAQAQLQLQQAALLYAKTEVVRYTALVKQDAATQIEVDHWIFERASAEANIVAAQAQVALAKLNLELYRGQGAVRRPDGQAPVDPGNVVGGGGQQAALAEITQLDPIYVVANLSSQQALQIRANLDQRRLTLADLHQGAGRCRAIGRDRVSPSAARSNMSRRRSIRRPARCWCAASCANPDRTLLPGFFVKIRLPMGKVEQSALLVPDRACRKIRAAAICWSSNKDDVVEQRYVQLGELIGDLRVITSGLKPDDRVVVGELWRADARHQGDAATDRPSAA